MDAQSLRDQVIRSEGYAEGFRAGYAACAQFVAKQKQAEAKDSQGDTEAPNPKD